jgi:hypothetical protein
MYFEPKIHQPVSSKSIIIFKPFNDPQINNKIAAVLIENKALYNVSSRSISGCGEWESFRNQFNLFLFRVIYDLFLTFSLFLECVYPQCGNMKYFRVKLLLSKQTVRKIN